MGGSPNSASYSQDLGGLLEGTVGETLASLTLRSRGESWLLSQESGGPDKHPEAAPPLSPSVAPYFPRGSGFFIRPGRCASAA